MLIPPDTQVTGCHVRQCTREDNCIVHIHYLAKGGGSWGSTPQTVICFPFWMELENPKTSKEKNFMRAQQQLSFAILLVSHRSMQGCNDLRERQMNGLQMLGAQILPSPVSQITKRTNIPCRFYFSRDRQINDTPSYTRNKRKVFFAR